MNGWQDKLAAVWKGPSWLPGKPRLGVDEDKLDVSNNSLFPHV
jgi:alkylglycerol monooxygenase